MKKILRIIFTVVLLFSSMQLSAAQPKFKALVLCERGGQHGAFTTAALSWLNGFAKENNFEFTEINNTDRINEHFLSNYKVFIQLNYPPYNWTDTAKKAFEKFIFEGRIGWVGFHHATLLGEFDGFKIWNWFSDFMGGIQFKNYIAPTASGKVIVEDSTHPVMEGVDPSFVLPHDEWYTFDKNPRSNIKVLAHVDESSYQPMSDIKMGDHPVIWTNEKMKARNVYFLFGHHADLLKNKNFVRMFGNAILWASGPANWFPRFRMLVHFNKEVELAHQQFARDAIKFLKDMTIGDGIVVDTTSNIKDFNDEKLRTYHLVVSLNDNPGHSKEEREAFQHYMENGGSWLGFHSAGFNNEETNWPWFTDFLGGAIFYRNSWPILPAKLTIDDPAHPVTKGMPASFISPMNEWYQWNPSPRACKTVKVFVTLSPDNYPIGFKDVVPDKDLPVVWSNTKYNMIYMNMGHGERIFADATQNYLIFNAIRWLMHEHFN